MKNTERQKILDKEKWESSIKNQFDMSGKMNYCVKCKYRDNFKNCTIEHNQRVQESSCAKAFNLKNKSC